MFAGGIFALAPSIEDTADAIEASPELAAKLARMREYSDAAEAVCRKAQPLLDARAAMRAIETALELNSTR